MPDDLHDLSALYALDVLDAAERARFEEHLAGCDRCTTDLAGLQTAATALAFVDGPPPPAELRSRIIATARVEPSNVVEGVLQDVHWSDSNFGYFPTYALGNVISVQLWERATSDLGDLDREFERGEFGSLREWLREHVHRWGRTFEPA